MPALQHLVSSAARCAAIALVAVLLAVATTPPARADGLLDLASFPREELVVRTRQGVEHRFRVWIADTPERQQQGLMFVRDLPADEGMLFPADPPRIASMWMKNTLIPLDMLFVDARGRIVTLHERTTPLSLQTLSSDRPVRGVLELRGGEAARRGIRLGDQVVHRLFRNPPSRPRGADTTARPRPATGG